MGGTGQNLTRLVVAVAATLGCLSALAPVASADRAFTARFSQNDLGNVDLIANTVLTCDTTLGANCANARNGTGTSTINNDFQMRYVDVDSDAATFNSSSANLSLPNNAEVLFAGLYWGGQLNAGGATGGGGQAAAPTPTANNTVKLDDPGAGGYNDITATQVDTGTGAQAQRYQAFANVTSLVTAAGNGTYTLANLQTSTGSDVFGGWSIVIAYRDVTQPARNLTIIDGLQSVQSNAAPISIPVSGFRTPPSGSVQTTAGFITYEGDLGLVGDSVQLNGTTLSDSLNPGGTTPNSFNSTIGKRGTRFSAKNPDYVNQLGYDADLFAADGILGNNATSATIRVQTNGDAYLPGVVTFATELYAPEIKPVKTAVDVNGGRLERGDLVEYTVRLTNTGDDRALGVVMRDQIPSGTTYVPGTLQQNTVSTGASCATGYATRTDGTDTDTGEFETANNRVVFRMGSGASDTAGGALSPNQTQCAKFRVRVNNTVPPRFTIDNVASADFTGESLGTSFNAVASNDTTDEVVAPDLTLTKSHTGGAFVGGNSYDFSLDVENAGNDVTSGSVTVTDSFPSASFASVNSVSGTGWNCSASSGLNVSCTRNDTLAAGADYPPIMVNATVVGMPPATIVNTATVSGGGDTNLGNNSGTDSSGATAQADLSILKTASETTVFAGDTTTFTLEVQNLGPSPAPDVQVTDALSPNFTAVSVTSSQGTCTTLVACDLNTLARNGTATIEIVARVNGSADGTTPRNTATVSDSGGSNDPVSSNNSSSVDITVPPTADLGVTKDYSPKPNPEAGEEVTWTIEVSNDGPATATGVTVVDSIPAEIATTPTPSATIQGGTCNLQAGPPRRIVCTVPSLASGASATMVVRGTLRSNAGSATVVNSVSVSGNQADQNSSNDSASSQFLAIPSADLDVVKSGPTNPVQVGNEFNYTLAAQNFGPSDAYGVELVDTLPAGLEFVSSTGASCTASGQIVTCPLGSVEASQGNERVFGPGSTASVTIRVRVLRAAASGASVTNEVEIRQRPDDSTNYPATPDPVATNNSDEVTTQVSQQADLSISKSVAPDPAGAGEDVTYTLTVENEGPSSAQNVEVTDDLPSGLTLVSATPEQGTCTQTDPVVCDLGDIGGNAAPVEIEIVAAVGPNQQGNTISNTASVVSDTDDPDSDNNEATEDLDISPAADLAITKTVSPGTVRAGEDVTYTLEISNGGPNPATNVQVTDDLPAGLTLVSATPDVGTCTQTDPVECDLGTIRPSDPPVQIVVVATVNAGREGTTISNEATVETDDQFDPDTSNNSSDADLDVSAETDLAITKVADSDAVRAGASVTYTVEVSNEGPNDATNVQVTDDLPGSLNLVSATPDQGTCTQTDPVACDLGTIPSGESAEILIVATVGNAQQGNTISNTATVESDEIDPDNSNDESTEEIEVSPEADLGITKSVDPDPVGAGTDVTYTLEVTNDGPNTATDVIVTDDLPAGLTLVSVTPEQGTCTQTDPVECELGDIPANAAPIEIEIVATVGTDQRGETITNTATVDGEEIDPVGGNDSATAELEVSPESDLEITKVADSSVAIAGGDVAYEIVVTNNGPNVATGVIVTDDLPAGLTLVSATPEQGNCTQTDPVECTLNSIPNGTSVGIELVATVGAAQTGNTISNTASVEGDQFDPDDSNDESTEDVSVRPEADLAITKSVDPEPARAGSDVTYTLTVSNDGRNDATGVTVADDLPAGLTLASVTPDQGTCNAADPIECELGDIDAGADAEVTIVAALGANQTGQTITNVASVDGDQFDPARTNNEASEELEVSAEADLEVTKVADPNPITAGQDVTYEISVFNNGPNAATNVSVTDDLPAGLTLVSATPEQGSCTQAEPVECDLDAIPAGETVEIEIVATVGRNQTGNTISNTASAESDEIDPDPSDDSATEDLDVTSEVDLAITKSVSPDPVRAGEEVTYVLTVANDGPNTATNVTVTDDLPTGLTLVSATPDLGTCTQTDPVECDLGTIAPADPPVQIDVVASVNDDQQGANITNLASVEGDQFDPDEQNNEASEELEVSAEADLEVTKVASLSPIAAGEDVTYTVSVTNNGPNVATNVTVEDDLPAGLTFVSATPEQGTCTQTDPVECDLNSIPVGDTVTIEIVATVGQNQTGNTISNTASAESDEIDPDPSDNTPTEGLDVTPEVDLAITKSASPDPVDSGSDVTYTLTVSNDGPNDATGVTVTDDLPASLTLVSATPEQGTCNDADPVECDLGDLAVGDDAEVAIVATVAENASGATISNTASVEGDQFDPDEADNEASEDVDVAPEADLEITKTADLDPIAGGLDVTYTVTVTNNGPNVATGVTVTDDLPAGLTLVSATPEQGNCTQTDPVECTLNSIPDGGSAEILIVATVGVDQTGNTITNTASVEGDQFDPDGANDAASEGVAVRAESDLAITKSVSPTRDVRVGENLSYSLTVTNNGPNTAQGVVITDEFDNRTKRISAIPSQGSCRFRKSSIRCELGDIADDGVVSIAVVARARHKGLLANEATVSASTFDSDASNDTDDASVRLDPARIQLLKRANVSRVGADGLVRFALTLRSLTGVRVKDVRVCDKVPSQFEVVRAPGAKIRGNTACWQVNISPRERRTFEITVRAEFQRYERRITNVATAVGPDTIEDRGEDTVTIEGAPGGGGPGTPGVCRQYLGPISPRC